MTATYRVSAVASAERISLTRAVSDTLVITRRNLLRNVRLPQLLVYSTVQPVMFLLLFQLCVRRRDRPSGARALRVHRVANAWLADSGRGLRCGPDRHGAHR